MAPAFHSSGGCQTPAMPSLAHRLAFPAALVFTLGLSAPAWAPPVQAQETRLNRCEGPAGDTIYTDRPCDSLGATARVVRGVPAPAGAGPYRSGCARTLPALTASITAAIDAHDVNGLASVYHWVGQNAESGDRILAQLQAIADRPLIDIAVLRATSAAPAPDATTDASATHPPALPGTAADTPASDAPAPAPRRAFATGLRLEQTLKNGSTPSRTVFGLRRYLECWWIVL